MADQQAAGGIGFIGALQLLFIGLKLGHVIDWSWLWVLSPILISWSVAIGFLLGVIVLLMIGILKG